MSLEHCARAHVIGDFNPFGGIGSTPSFQLLAKRDDWLERFQTLLRAPAASGLRARARRAALDQGAFAREGVPGDPGKHPGHHRLRRDS